MEKRQFGKTDMEFSVLGIGGAETCYSGDNQAALAAIEMVAKIDTARLGHYYKLVLKPKKA